MGKKYFCWNIDDGVEQDKKIVGLLHSFGMGATFNLNAGLFGHHQMTRWENDHPVADVPLEEAARLSGNFVQHYRIPRDEAVQVYEGFEIAAHGYRHENMDKLTAPEITASIAADRDALSGLFGQEITGFAYPYGIFNDTVVACLRKLCIRYARTTKEASSFSMPGDLLRLSLTARHQDPNIFRRLDAFMNAETEEDLFFLMFAHGFEFDFNTPESNWEKLKRICDAVANRTDIICCSTGEALRTL